MVLWLILTFIMYINYEVTGLDIVTVHMELYKHILFMYYVAMKQAT